MSHPAWTEDHDSYGYPGSMRLRLNDHWWHSVQPTSTGRWRVVKGPSGIVIGRLHDTMAKAQEAAEAHARECARADYDEGAKRTIRGFETLGLLLDTADV